MPMRPLTLLLFLFLLPALLPAATEEVYYCKGDRLNLRVKPSAESKVITQLDLGRPLVVMDEFEGWCKVYITRDSVGWVKKEYLISENEFKRFQATDNNRKQLETYAKERNASAPAGPLKIAYCIKNAVNVRAKPDFSAAVAAKAAFGDLFEVTRTQGEWTEVNLEDGSRGFVLGELLGSKKEMDDILQARVRGGTTTAAAVEVVRNVAKRVVVRSGPTREAEIVGYVFAGDTLLVSDWCGKFARVFFPGGGSGWVLDALLRTDVTASEQRKGETIKVVAYTPPPPDYKHLSGEEPEVHAEKGREENVQARERMLDSLKRSYENREADLKGEYERRMEEQKAGLAEQVEEEKKKREEALDALNERLKSSKANYEKEKADLRRTIDDKEKEWRGQQAQWETQQKSQLETLQKDKEDALARKQTEMEDQKAGM